MIRPLAGPEPVEAGDDPLEVRAGAVGDVDVDDRFATSDVHRAGAEQHPGGDRGDEPRRHRSVSEAAIHPRSTGSQASANRAPAGISVTAAAASSRVGK